MLHLITVGKERINVDNITHVTDLTIEDEEEIKAKAIVWLLNLQTIILTDLDAISFLDWWDKIAADIHGLYNK